MKSTADMPNSFIMLPLIESSDSFVINTPERYPFGIEMLKENRSASHWMPEYAILGNKTDMLLSRNSKKALIQCYILFYVFESDFSAVIVLDTPGSCFSRSFRFAVLRFEW